MIFVFYTSARNWARTSDSNFRAMTCALCGRSHWDSLLGDTGGTPSAVLEQSGSLEFLAKEEQILLFNLTRCRKLRLNRIPICLVSTKLPLLRPRDVRLLSLSCSLRFPLGIVTISLDLGACYLFTGAPRRIGLKCAIELVRTRLSFGLAVQGGKIFILQVGRRRSIMPVIRLLRSLLFMHSV